MSRIFYSREGFDIGKFIFENIDRDTILIVPEQFSFQMEMASFEHMKKSALLGFDIMGFSRLGEKILKEAGISLQKIGNEGKNMMLSKIALEHGSGLKLFGENAHKLEFIDMMQEIIRTLKQREIDANTLREYACALDEKSILSNKLLDIAKIYDEYIFAMKDRYTDTQDYADAYNDNIEKATFLEGKSIWIYGFDAFDKKRLETIRRLGDKCKSLNIILTYDNSDDSEIFAVGKESLSKLRMTLGLGEDDICKIDESYRLIQARGISLLEENLFKEEILSHSGYQSHGAVRITACGNPYYECVNSAAYISKMVREKGFRFRDISIICNSLEEKKAMYKSVFKDFGIELFIDEKRSLKGNRAFEYVDALLRALAKDFRDDSVIELLRRNWNISDDDLEELEIYVQNYFIDGAKWQNAFQKGEAFYGENELNRFNYIRERFVEPLFNLQSCLKEKVSVDDRLKLVYDFLADEAGLIDYVESPCDEEELTLEEALELKQVWNKIADVMMQMSELLGDMNMQFIEFIEILSMGISSIEIGIIPPATDSLIMGDTARSKRDKAKLTVILGAQEGSFPQDDGDSGILNDDEIDELKSKGLDIQEPRERRRAQALLDAYRCMANTTEQVYISYSKSQSDGGELNASQLIDKIKESFDDIGEENDCMSEENILELAPSDTIFKTAVLNAMGKSSQNTEEKNILLQEALNVLKEDEDFASFLNMMRDLKMPMHIPMDLARQLYQGEAPYLKLSPSRLELYGKCPFAHFISYGLRPKVPQEYKVVGADLGSIYHRCLKMFSEKVMQNPEKEFDAEDIENIVEDILEDIYVGYKEGILDDDGEAAYRKKRIKSVCSDSARGIYDQLKNGSISHMYFEKNFGRNRDISGVSVGNADKWQGAQMIVEGQIDRLDILKNHMTRVVDYKSGNDAFNLAKSLKGISLQLFIYLMASEGIEDCEDIKAGGSFFFNIKEDFEERGKTHGYKLDGFMRDELKSQMNKNTFKSSGAREFSEEDFSALMNDMKKVIDYMADDIYGGRIAAEPKAYDNITSCTYCKYRGICRFDTSIEECRYDVVK